MEEQIRILLVDDEINVLRSLERTFLDEEYEILTAPSGSEGLAAMQENGIAPRVAVCFMHKVNQTITTVLLDRKARHE
jgi:DNA-binding NtrC family response regulator